MNGRFKTLQREAPAMDDDLIRTITSPDDAVRNRSLEELCRRLDTAELLRACDRLDRFRRDSENLYQRVRALFFLSSIYRYQLPEKLPAGAHSLLPYDGYTHLLNRRFDEAIDAFLARWRQQGPSDTIASALAVTYHQLGFQTLADQVRRSVRSVRGNRWM
ncbi:MAG: UTP--glucose-1-phosphate uridylyltransferase, partial [Planctomycetes bacterium]|nr:UTP--glucose-1-phosphate uridylyltransferase [Planctomycetota bacterium]